MKQTSGTAQTATANTAGTEVSDVRAVRNPEQNSWRLEALANSKGCVQQCNTGVADTAVLLTESERDLCGCVSFSEPDQDLGLQSRVAAKP